MSAVGFGFIFNIIWHWCRGTNGYQQTHRTEV